VVVSALSLLVCLLAAMPADRIVVERAQRFSGFNRA
jgi:hypothetical protein